jgi:NSS family neurotransmitter:Na+ symporter
VVMGIACWLFGLLTVFSFNIWSDITPLYMIETFRDKTLFDLLDYLTANIMLPLGGLLIAIFSVWIMHEDASVDELNMGEGLTYQIWHFLVRYITPIAVIIVFLRAIEVI